MIAEQRSLIQDLAKSNEDYTRKFEQLKLSCDSVPVHPEPILADNYNSMPTPKITTTQGSVQASAVGATSLTGPSTGAQGLSPGPYMGSWYFHESDTSLPDQLSWLQQQYRKLMSTLLMEVSAPTYEIADDSRSRIKAEIVTIHIREMEHMEQIQYSRPASLARATAGPVQQRQAQPCSSSRRKPNQQMQIQQIQAQQKSRMRNQQTQAQQQSFSYPIPIEPMQHSYNRQRPLQQMQAQPQSFSVPIPIEQMQQSINGQRPLQQMQAQQQNFNGSIPGEQMQGQQQSFSSQSASDYSASKINRDQIGTPLLHKALPMPQNATYQNNALGLLGMGANPHSTRGEHEQTSAAQSRPPMASMRCTSPPPRGYFQHSAMGPIAATPLHGTISSGVDPPATTLDSHAHMPLSTPLPYFGLLSPSPAAQSPFQGRHHTLPNSDKAVAQESSNYGPSVPQNYPPRAESPTLVSQGHASKTVSSRTSVGLGLRKRKLDSTSLSSQLPVIDPCISPSKNISSSPRLYKNARRRNDHTAVTENTKTSKVGATGEMHLATSCNDSGNQKASENNAVYSMDVHHRRRHLFQNDSYNAHRESCLERTLENHTPEDWAENVVDELLAAWTTLPVSAIRPASQHAGFAVVAV